MLGFGSCGIIHHTTKEPVQFEVSEKEAVGGEDSKYLIYTENDEVFENRDAIWALKFNSSDVYAELDEGKCYESEAWGFRVPFLSMYRGIDQVSEIDCSML